MSEKIEGTLVLDGLLEGRLADLDAVQPKLREWRAFVEKAGLRFNLECEGNAFSLLADNAPVPVAKLSGDPGEVVAAALNELLKVLPAAERGRVFSTVRSHEYRKGEEVQTLYAVGPDGTIQTRERTVEAQTTTPEAPPGIRQKILAAGIGLAIAAVLLWASSFFVDYGATWRSWKNNLWPLDVKALEVDAKTFESYFTVADKKSSAGATGVVVTLKRTAVFPLTDADAEKAAKEAGDSLAKRMALEAVVRGRLCVEYYDKDNKLITFSFVLIKALRDQETLDVEMPLPKDRRAARIVFAQ